MAVSINFIWHKDASGYHLVKKGSLSGDRPTIDTIIPNGGERILIRPMETADLYRVFAHVDSTEQLLEFVEKFGLLGHYEGRRVSYRPHRDQIDGSEPLEWHEDYEGMPVGEHLKQAALFRDALRLKAKGPEQLAAFLKTISSPTMGPEQLAAFLKYSPIPIVGPTADLGFLQLIPDRVAGARFQIMPIALIQALWFQLGQVLTSDIKLSTCLHCGQLFEAGLRTGRRADAKFCSDEHRTLYHSLHRKPVRRS